MNIRRWLPRLPRRRPLIVALLALVAALVPALVPAAPASARAFDPICNLSMNDPRGTATYVSATASIFCSGPVSSTYVSIYLTRDGSIVDSGLGSSFASAGATCVPGRYRATADGGVFYLSGGFTPFSPFNSSTLYFDCTTPVPPLTVVNPGNQWSFAADSAYLQMTATGGTAPYTWSATGLPTGLSINATTGLITGPTGGLRTYAVTVTAVDASGRSASASFSWRIVRDNCPLC